MLNFKKIVSELMSKRQAELFSKESKCKKFKATLEHINDTFGKFPDKVKVITEVSSFGGSHSYYVVHTSQGDRCVRIITENYRSVVTFSESYEIIPPKCRNNYYSISQLGIIYEVRLDISRTFEDTLFEQNKEVKEYNLKITTPRLDSDSKITEEQIFLSIKELSDMADSLQNRENEHRENTNKFMYRF